MRAVLALLALCVVLVGGGRAEAHAALVAAEPAAGSVVAEAPAAATLTFSEPVSPLAVRWFRSDASPLDAVPEAEGARLVVPLPAGPVSGTLVLSWRVVSADGHPIGGSHVFSIGAPTTVAPADGKDTATSRPAVAAAVARGALTVALVLGVGGAVFLGLVAPGTALPRARRLALFCAGATLPLGLVATGLHGTDMLGAPTAALFGAGPWTAALGSRFAASATASALAGLLAFVALRRGGSLLALLAWAAAAAAFALFGHAANAPPRVLTVPAVALHAVTFIFWIGALPGLAESATGPRPALVANLRRFSHIAIPLVALLFASGAVLAAAQLREPAALVTTAYGRLLSVKLVAVAFLLALAIANRLWLTPAIVAGAQRAPRRFHRSVLAEITLGMLVIGLASGFRLVPPPRAAIAAPAEISAHLHGPALMANVTLHPGPPGANDVGITLFPGKGEAPRPKEVRIAFADPTRGVEPIRLAATGSGGDWRAGPLLLPHGGEWTVVLDVLVSDFAQQRLEGRMTITER